jgi:transposase
MSWSFTGMASQDDPSRRQALRAQGLFNPTAAEVRDERFEDEGFFDPADLVQVRYAMLRSVRMGDRSATGAAAAFGVSRATYYQTLAAFGKEGIVGLIPEKRGPRGPHKLTDDVVEYVMGQLEQKPDLDSPAVARLVSDQFGVVVHPRSVERAMDRRRKKKRQDRR